MPAWPLYCDENVGLEASGSGVAQSTLHGEASRDERGPTPHHQATSSGMEGVLHPGSHRRDRLPEDSTGLDPPTEPLESRDTHRTILAVHDVLDQTPMVHRPCLEGADHALCHHVLHRAVRVGWQHQHECVCRRLSSQYTPGACVCADRWQRSTDAGESDLDAAGATFLQHHQAGDPCMGIADDV